MEKQTCTMKEAAQQLGLGYNAILRAAKTGQIPTFRIGGRILVSKLVLMRLLADPGAQEPAVGVVSG